MKSKLRQIVLEVDLRAGHRDLPLLSVSIHSGVVPRSSLTDDLPRAEDLSNYKCCANSDLVLNRMRAFQGAIGISPEDGLVSPDYLVLRSVSAEPRYLSHLFRSDWFVGEMTSRIRGIGSVDLGSARTPRINASDLLDIEVDLPDSRAEQRRIADFLDDQVARIENIVAAREKQLDALEALRLNVSFAALSGSTGSGERKDSGLPWLGTIPMAWPMSTVHSAFEVVLGKMLDESRFSGEYATPYLRNTNVQWDHIHVDDLKVMDIPPSEYDRFTVRSGDLLICEGGQPGRSAVWRGGITPLGFQKALHRARPRGDCDVRWLQIFLRVAVGLSVFASEFGQSTISHLTGEQLRSARIPIPPAAVQARLCDQVDSGLALIDAVQLGLRGSIDLLGELKRSLITAAVTGEFDVSSADGSRVPV